MQQSAGYKLVKLACGVHSVHSLAHRETFHPVIGPVAEAEAQSGGVRLIRDAEIEATLRAYADPGEDGKPAQPTAALTVR